MNSNQGNPNLINENNTMQNKVHDSQFSFNQQSFPSNNQPTFKIIPKSTLENIETTNRFMHHE